MTRHHITRRLYTPEELAATLHIPMNHTTHEERHMPPPKGNESRVANREVIAMLPGHRNTHHVFTTEELRTIWSSLSAISFDAVQNLPPSNRRDVLMLQADTIRRILKPRLDGAA